MSLKKDRNFREIAEITGTTPSPAVGVHIRFVHKWSQLDFPHFWSRLSLPVSVYYDCFQTSMLTLFVWRTNDMAGLYQSIHKVWTLTIQRRNSMRWGDVMRLKRRGKLRSREGADLMTHIDTQRHLRSRFVQGLPRLWIKTRRKGRGNVFMVVFISVWRTCTLFYALLTVHRRETAPWCGIYCLQYHGNNTSVL